MKQYLELTERVLTTGEWTENRTGIKTLMVPGAMMTFDVAKGFPAVTTKKLAFRSVVGELCAFLRASRSAADFRALGCKVWDQNANENEAWLANPFRKGTDDLGPVYGVQWREWSGVKILPDPVSPAQLHKAKALHDHVTDTGWSFAGRTHADNASIYTKQIDMLGDCVRTIITNPDSRRILFHGWNPAVLDEVALPACHLLYQFLPNRKTGKLHMNLYIRSNDLGLGAPFNIAEGALLQSLVARLTGFAPGLLNYFIGDAHIYENHMEMVQTQLTRVPFDAPQLLISDRVPTFRQMLDPHDPIGLHLAADKAVEWLKLVEPSDFTLENYVHHEAISAPMAV